MDVVVQPSVPWMSLNDQIKKSGLFFPVDPGPSVSKALASVVPIVNHLCRLESVGWSEQVAGTDLFSITKI
jgi:FAD/FMN-containing dehydrogenase